MKQKSVRSLLFLCLSLFSVVVYGQKEDIRVEFHAQGTAWPKEFKPYELGFDVGYNLTDRLFLNLRFENAIALFKINGQKDYFTNGIYGLNVGYSFFDCKMCKFDVRVGLGDNMRKNKDWKYNYYDAGVYMHLGEAKVKPCFGFGVRHYNSRNSLHKDYTRLFMSLGLSFGA